VIFLGQQVLAVERPVAIVWTDGQPVEGGGASTFTIEAAIQPLTARERELLPEGNRQRASFSLWTLTELRTHNVAAQTPADVVLINGRRLEVIGVEDWAAAHPEGLPHFKCILGEKAGDES
jgi:hypothetical protein